MYAYEKTSCFEKLVSFSFFISLHFYKYINIYRVLFYWFYSIIYRGRRGRMVVGFTTTYAITSYSHIAL